ncbi:hypothetical protein [Streptosporangium sp. 'caverna']|uniref:hypothetical protein n=1 Tax=Streptosporangium sp. 'caverna' TaxID=2202249 RepID=UPI000D7E6501|nr:hypothetical protein [Streptosporangium sp. 'caverna']AWS44888.1 hypothetical protein DKM19_29805 [Streptosporangium sp. 'caverna']
MRKLAWFLSLVLLLSADGSRSRMPLEKFQDRAREVIDRWRGSEMDRAWRDGFVPLNGLDVEPEWMGMPGWVGVSKTNGAWALDVDLPTGSPAGTRLRWPDGSTLTVPLITAAAAYAERSKPDDFVEEDCPPGGCTTLRVTGAELRDIPFLTSRGIIQVPAWHFTVKGVRKKFIHAAISPSVTTSSPTPPEGEYREVMAFEHVPKKPRELLLQYEHDSCDHTHGTRAYETRDLVVVDVDVRSSAELCLGVGLIDQIAITLSQPLGDRLLLDSGTGLPPTPGIQQTPFWWGGA